MALTDLNSTRMQLPIARPATASSTNWLAPIAGGGSYTSVPNNAASFLQPNPPAPAWSGAYVEVPNNAGSYLQPPGTAPTSAPTGGWAPTAGNMAGPGVAEQWYAANQSRFNPSSTELGDYWRGVEGSLTGQRFGTSYASNAYAPAYAAMAGQGAGGQNAQQVSGQLLAPGAGTGATQAAGNYFAQPGMSQTYAQQVQGSGYFQTPGQSEQYNQQVQARLGQRGQGGVAAGGVLDATHYGQGAINAVNAAAPGTTRTADLYNSAFPDFNARNTVGSESEHFLPGLRDKSYSENLYESGNQGLNTFYDRERAKRQEALETKMAAMGVYGSGDTAKSLYELEGELGAAQARDMAALAGQADQARLGRSGEARAFSTAAGAEEQARMGLTADTANAADDNRIALLAQQLEAQGLASTEALAKAREYSKLDDDELKRLQLGGELAGQADTQGRARYTDLADIVGQGDQSGLARARGSLDVGRELSADQLARLQASGDLGLRADQEARARVGQQFDMATSMEEQDRAWKDQQLAAHTFERDTAAGVDKAADARLGTEWGAAKDVQDIYQSRERGSLQDIMGVATAKAKLVSDSLKDADKEKFDSEMAEITRMVAEGAITRAEGEQRTEETLKWGELLLKGAALL